MGSNLSLFQRAINGLYDYNQDLKSYWSSHTLMEGYAEAAHENKTIIQEATKDSPPLIKAVAGCHPLIELLAGIPVGITHWINETAHAGIKKNPWEGFKTFASIFIHGVVDSGKFVVNQAGNWSRGEIPEDEFGIAEEVTTTLGTAALLFFGLKGAYNGGNGMISGLGALVKNTKIGPTPAMAMANGGIVASPAPTAVGMTSGVGPVGIELTYMVGKKPDSGKGPSEKGERAPEGSKTEKTIENTDDWVAYNLIRALDLNRRRGPEPLPPVTDRVIKETAKELVPLWAENPAHFISFLDAMTGLDPRLVKEIIQICEDNPKYSRIMDELRKPETTEMLFSRWDLFEIPDELYASIIEIYPF